MSRKRPRSFEPANKTSQKTQNSENCHTPTTVFVSNLDQLKGEPVRYESNKDKYGWIFDRVVAFFLLMATAGGTYYIYKTDETTRQSQRAFVAVRDISVDPLGPLQLPSIMTDDGPGQMIYSITMAWENNGSTETKDLEIGNTLIINGHPGVPVWPIKDRAGQKRVLLPKASTQASKLTTGGSDLNNVRDGRTFIFIFGFAKYRDAFGAKHLTLACFEIGAAPIDYTKEGAKGAGGYQCGEYNCADEDCKRYDKPPELKELLAYLD